MDMPRSPCPSPIRVLLWGAALSPARQTQVQHPSLLAIPTLTPSQVIGQLNPSKRLGLFLSSRTVIPRLAGGL